MFDAILLLSFKTKHCCRSERLSAIVCYYIVRHVCVWCLLTSCMCAKYLCIFVWTATNEVFLCLYVPTMCMRPIDSSDTYIFVGGI